MVEAIDEQTGEVFGNPFDDLPDDGVLEYIEFHKRAETIHRTERQQAEYELTRRMNERSATVYVSPDWNVKLVPQVEYKYNTDLLSKLPLNGISFEEFERTVRIQFNINKVELNKLVKRGGRIKEIIDEATTTIPKAPKLDIKRVEL